MRRVFALLAAGLALSACSSMPDLSLPSFSMPSFGLGSSAPVGSVSVKVESEPPGAEARLPSGTACRTPCSLAVPAGATTVVSFAHTGYLPQSVPVQVLNVKESWDNAESGNTAETATVEPNPVYALLQPAPPPPPPPRKRAPKKKPAQAAPQQQQQQQQTSGFGVPPSSGFR